MVRGGRRECCPGDAGKTAVAPTAGEEERRCWRSDATKEQSLHILEPEKGGSN